MRVLAIETATDDVAAGVADENGPLACVTVRSRRRHAELLHPLVVQVCELAGITLGQIDAVGLDIGPGLFTGIRVGVAAAKGWAISLGIPIVALTSLDILRASCEAIGVGSASTVVPVVDLKRGEIAWSLAEADMAYGAPEELAAIISGTEGPVVLAGDGALRHAAVLCGDDSLGHASVLRGDDGSDSPAAVGSDAGGDSPGAVGIDAGGDSPAAVGSDASSPKGRAAWPRMLAGVELASPPVASLAVLAVGGAREGRGVDPLEVLPVYLREADARINWSTRHDAPALVAPGPGEL